uniref:Uncharacterized protein n=1 Tax=Arundo donax TaxID=35708 RepID=A0A0A9DTU7_ARUDO
MLLYRLKVLKQTGQENWVGPMRICAGVGIQYCPLFSLPIGVDANPSGTTSSPSPSPAPVSTLHSSSGSMPRSALPESPDRRSVSVPPPPGAVGRPMRRATAVSSVDAPASTSIGSPSSQQEGMQLRSAKSGTRAVGVAEPLPAASIRKSSGSSSESESAATWGREAPCVGDRERRGSASRRGGEGGES